MRWLAACFVGVAALAGPADQAVARWTLLEGGRVGIGGKTIAAIEELPAGDFQVEMVDWVAVNAVPEDLERMTGLRHLRELRLPGPLWNRNADSGKDLSKSMQFLAPVTTLEKLTFSDHFLDRIRFRDSGLDAIATLTGLRELAIRQAEVKGSGLRHFPGLQSLDLTLCPLGDLRPLTGMKSLRRLWAGDTFVNDLAPLAGLTALEDLDLHGTGVRDDTVVYLGGLPALRRLDLQGTEISDASVETLAKLGNLDTLNLYRTKISNAGLAKLQRLAKLRSIDVRYTRVTAAGVDAFRAARPGARIQFAGGGGRAVASAPPPAGAGAAGLAAWVKSLGGTARLEEGFVSLRGVPLQESAVAALARIPGLRVLDLEATELGDGAAGVLATIGTLEELSLNSTQLSDTGLAVLGGLRRLKRLRLDNTYVEGLAFARWPADAPLEELSVLGSPVGNGAMEGIVRFARLRKLVLAESDVTGSGLAVLAALPLEHLDLAAADIGDDAPLERFSSLRFLRLRDTRITDSTLLKKIGNLRALETLDLARTRTSNASMAALGALTGLRRLNLAYAEMDDIGFAKLSGLTQLEELNLDSTHITDEGVRLFSAFSKLKKLDVYHTLLTERGIAALREALPGAMLTWDKDGALPHRRRA